MNARRRKAIDEIVSQLESLQVDLAYVKDEEEEAHDNTPESLQETDSYLESEEALEHMDDADGALQEAIDYLTEIL